MLKDEKDMFWLGVILSSVFWLTLYYFKHPAVLAAIWRLCT